MISVNNKILHFNNKLLSSHGRSTIIFEDLNEYITDTLVDVPNPDLFYHPTAKNITMPDWNYYVIEFDRKYALKNLDGTPRELDSLYVFTAIRLNISYDMLLDTTRSYFEPRYYYENNNRQPDILYREELYKDYPIGGEYYTYFKNWQENITILDNRCSEYRIRDDINWDRFNHHYKLNDNSLFTDYTTYKIVIDMHNHLTYTVCNINNVWTPCIKYDWSFVESMTDPIFKPTTPYIEEIWFRDRSSSTALGSFHTIHYVKHLRIAGFDLLQDAINFY